MTPLEDFCQAVAGLRGRRCEKVRGGFGVGSMVWLDFGPFTERTFKKETGELFSILDSRDGLNLENAAWRIETIERIVCSSESDNTIGGPMDEGLSLIRGAVIETSIHARFSNRPGPTHASQLELFLSSLGRSDRLRD